MAKVTRLTPGKRSRGVYPVDVCFSLQTVGVLTVAKASVSGIYRCVASNPSGSDHLDVHFYVTGDAETKMGKGREKMMH